MTRGPLSGCACFSGGGKSGWISRRTCSCASAKVVTTCVVAAPPMRVLALLRSPCASHNPTTTGTFGNRPRTSLQRWRACITAAGGVAEMHTTSGVRLCDKIDHLAGRGRERDGLHEAFAGGQQLRQHHSGDLIRLVAGGQAEDARPRRSCRPRCPLSPALPAGPRPFR